MCLVLPYSTLQTSIEECVVYTFLDRIDGGLCLVLPYSTLQTSIEELFVVSTTAAIYTVGLY